MLKVLQGPYSAARPRTFSICTIASGVSTSADANGFPSPERKGDASLLDGSLTVAFGGESGPVGVGEAKDLLRIPV
jgi:hypothetical protein